MQDGGDDDDQDWVDELADWCRESQMEGDGGGFEQPFTRFRQACIDRGLPKNAQIRSWNRAKATLVAWSKDNEVTEKLRGDQEYYQAPEVRPSADMVAFIRDNKVDIEGADELDREDLSEAFLLYELEQLRAEDSDDDSIVEARVSHHPHPLLPPDSKVGAFRWWRRYKKRDDPEVDMEDDEAEFVSTVVLVVGDFTREMQPLWVGLSDEPEQLVVGYVAAGAAELDPPKLGESGFDLIGLQAPYSMKVLPPGQFGGLRVLEDKLEAFRYFRDCRHRRPQGPSVSKPFAPHVVENFPSRAVYSR